MPERKIIPVSELFRHTYRLIDKGTVETLIARLKHKGKLLGYILMESKKRISKRLESYRGASTKRN